MIKCNNFVFDGQHYLQIQGTAIGRKTTPSYATMYMESFKDKFVYTYLKQPQLWLCFIDDIFLIWGHWPKEFDTFEEHLNSQVNSIKFTVVKYTDEVVFLDTKIKMVAGNLRTDLLTKPTDSHSYLRFDSDHSSSCKTSIPSSQFLRIRRFCSELEDYKKHAMEMTGHFVERGYSLDLLIEAALK